MLPDTLRLIRRAIGMARATGLSQQDAAVGVASAFIALAATFNGNPPAGPVQPQELRSWLDDLATTAGVAGRAAKAR